MWSVMPLGRPTAGWCVECSNQVPTAVSQERESAGKSTYDDLSVPCTIDRVALVPLVAVVCVFELGSPYHYTWLLSESVVA